MKMSKRECIKFYNLIIEANGRPTENVLNKNFPVAKATELSRGLNIGKMAVVTDEKLVFMAKKALENFA